jgi:hypothetical protein
MYSSHDIVNSRGGGGAATVVLMDQIRNMHKILVPKPQWEGQIM